MVSVNYLQVWRFWDTEHMGETPVACSIVHFQCLLWQSAIGLYRVDCSRDRSLLRTSGLTRWLPRASTSESISSGPAARRQVSISKWQRQSLFWLRCNKDPTDRSQVSTLFCGVCQQYESKIVGMSLLLG